MTWITSLLSRLEFMGVFVIGGLGLAFSVCCLIHKHRLDRAKEPKEEFKEPLLHLANSILNMTFTAVTLVAAVHVGLQVHFHLPTIVRDAAVDSNRAVLAAMPPPLDPGVVAGAVESGMGSLADEIDGVRLENSKELERILEALDREGRETLAEGCLRLVREGRLSDATLTQLFLEHFGDLVLLDGALYIRTPGEDRNFEVSPAPRTGAVTTKLQ